MQSNSSGQVRLTATLDYHAPLNKTVTVEVKVQRSTDGVTWTDTGVSVIGGTAEGGNAQYGGDVPGYLTLDATASGMAASTNHTFRLISIINSQTGGVSSVGVSGSFAGAQS
jgi:hypothetical protein